MEHFHVKKLKKNYANSIETLNFNIIYKLHSIIKAKTCIIFDYLKYRIKK
jgi:hypothetical protein